MLGIVWHLGDLVDSTIEKYRIGDMVHNMGEDMEYKTCTDHMDHMDNINVTLLGQHQDHYG